MAHCYPSINEVQKYRVQLTEGEDFLLKNLLSLLDDSFEIFVQPFLNGDRPEWHLLKL